MTTKFGSAQEIDQRLEKLGRQRELVHRIKKTGIVCIVALFGSGFLGALLSIIGIFDDPPEFFTVIIVVLFVLAFVLTLSLDIMPACGWKQTRKCLPRG